jgi:hypothetical protein
MFGQSVIVDMQVNEREREKKIESYTAYIFKELYKVNQYISFGICADGFKRRGNKL